MLSISRGPSVRAAEAASTVGALMTAAVAVARLCRHPCGMLCWMSWFVGVAVGYEHRRATALAANSQVASLHHGRRLAAAGGPLQAQHAS